MMDSLEINNTTYMDKLRLFSGDTPASQLESGQNVEVFSVVKHYNIFI